MQENILKENLNPKPSSICNTETKSEYKFDTQTDTEYLQLFCKDKTKINEKDECGWTPLYRTVVSGILAATESLLNNGADPNIPNTMGETPLYQAVEMCKISHVNLLLQKGADPNISQIDGLSPLHLAVDRQNILIIKELLKYKADPNNKTLLYEQTPLHFAIKNNVDPMILLILVQYNGNLTMKDKFGKRPLDYVSSEEMKKVIEKLKYENDNEKEKENNDIHEIKKIRYNTPNKEIKWSESKMLSDSGKRDFEIKETQVNFNGNIILKNPGNLYQNFYKVKSGTINNDENDTININIRKRLFNKVKYNKKLFNKSFNNSKYKIDKRCTINPKTNFINKALFNKIKNNILKEQQNNQYTTYKKEKKDLIPNNFSTSNKKNYEYYITLQNEEEKSCMSQKTYYDGFIINKKKKQLNIPLLPLAKQIKYKNNFNFSDKANKSTYINSDISTSSKKDYLYNKITTDYNTISDTKKYTLIPRDSRNNKVINQYSSNKKNIIWKSDKKFKTINFSEEKEPLDRNIKEKRMIDEYLNRKKKLYIKPRINMNDSSSVDKNNNSGYNYNINRNNTANNNSLFNHSNKIPKGINTSNTSINSSSINNDIIDDKKGPLKLKKFRLQKKIFNIKNFNIPFDKKKVPYYNRNTYNSCTNTYNSNSINNDSFYDSASNYYIRKKHTCTSTSVCDSIILEPEKYPIYDWLSTIGLSFYSSLFIQKKIFDLKKIIHEMKKGKIKMTPKDIYKIGIRTPGHIFRIFVKLELDSGIIDKKIYDYIEKIKKGPKEEEINILNNSIYNICGCCSLKEKSKSTCKKKNDNNIYDIDQWLLNINMTKYKQNFFDNGFDKFEYFFLQMFGSFPIDFNILKNSLGIESEKDRDLILLQLQKDVKYLAMKSSNLNKKMKIPFPKAVKSNNKINNNTNNKELKRSESQNQECIIF